jgi:hypothetical protein
MLYYLSVEHTPVISSAITSLGYDRDSKILEVVLINGAIYQYLNVPEEIYGDFLAAKSKGTYFNTVFKSYGFEYRQL